jgi:hypothetical protein
MFVLTVFQQKEQSSFKEKWVNGLRGKWVQRYANTIDAISQF